MAIEKTGAPKLFSPAKRMALLINAYDDPRTFISREFDEGKIVSSGKTYSRLYASRGNLRIFRMEAALRRGDIEIADDMKDVLIRFLKNPKTAVEKRSEEISKIARALKRIHFKYGLEETWERAERMAYPSEDYEATAMMALSILDLSDSWEFMDAQKHLRSDIRYDHINKIFPDMKDAKAAAYKVLDFYSTIATKDTLTYLFITAHGETYKVADFPYKELLEKLDRIAGKKVLVIMACHSGVLQAYLAEKDNYDDYLALTATKDADERSINWNEDEIVNEITDDLIMRSNPLSKFGSEGKLHMAGGLRFMQIAGSFCPFDVIL